MRFSCLSRVCPLTKNWWSFRTVDEIQVWMYYAFIRSSFNSLHFLSHHLPDAISVHVGLTFLVDTFWRGLEEETSVQRRVRALYLVYLGWERGNAVRTFFKKKKKSKKRTKNKFRANADSWASLRIIMSWIAESRSSVHRKLLHYFGRRKLLEGEIICIVSQSYGNFLYDIKSDI